jgi:hypothetical protein
MKQNFYFRCTFLLLIAFVIPVMGFAQAKNVISTFRVFPKVDKVQEFEKALASHAQKFHTGDVSWRVFAIQSGPDAGGYHVTEGPTSWEALDSRGDLGQAHETDWHKNVAIHLTDRQSAGYSVYIDTLSTIALDDFTDKINITHVYPKIGKGDEVVKIIKKLRKGWQASGISMAVYSASSSGPAQYTIVTRYKQGLKERATGFRKPFKEVYESIYGESSWNDYIESLSENTEKSWSELLFLRKDLSSK